MTGRPTLAEAENGEGETVLVPLQLDAESLRILRKTPRGRGSAFARKVIADFLDWLEAHRESPARVPLQVPGGVTSVVFQMKAPAGLAERARDYVGPGRPYTTLSGLARTAIHRADRRPRGKRQPRAR